MIPAQVFHNIACCVALFIVQVLTFTVNTVTAIPMVPANNFYVIYFPNPTGTFLYIDSLKLIDNWQRIDIIATNGATTLSFSLKGLCPVENGHQCFASWYLFRHSETKNNANAYLKFVKQ